MRKQIYYRYRVQLQAQLPDSRFVNLCDSLNLRNFYSNTNRHMLDRWFYFYANNARDPVLIRPTHQHTCILHPGISRWIGHALRPSEQARWISANWISTTEPAQDSNTKIIKPLGRVCVKPSMWNLTQATDNKISNWCYHGVSSPSKRHNLEILAHSHSILDTTTWHIVDQELSTEYVLNLRPNNTHCYINLKDHNNNLFDAVRELFHTVLPHPSPTSAKRPR